MISQVTLLWSHAWSGKSEYNDPPFSQAILDKCNLFKVKQATRGHIGEGLEYYEFDPGNTNQAVYIAQKSGVYWHVYKVWPSKHGRVITLATGYTDGEAAALFALDALNANLERSCF